MPHRVLKQNGQRIPSLELNERSMPDDRAFMYMGNLSLGSVVVCLK